MAFSLSLVQLLLLATSTLAEATFERPNGTDNWICLPTSGGADTHGGNINMTRCGSTCDGAALPWVGYIGAALAVIFFGSNFIPVKKFDTGDGLFFQWVMCVGIWLVGVVINVVQLQPPFFVPALLGGFLWTTGNIVAVPIIKMIGLTMGLTVWGSTNLLAGWISGRFILKQDISCSGLNIGGVGTVLISTFILAFVKSEGKSVRSNETAPLLEKKEEDELSISGDLRKKLVHTSSVQSEEKLSFSSQHIKVPLDDPEDEDVSWVDRLGVWPRRVIGFGLALVSGFFYGFEFLPIQYMQLCDDSSHSCSLLDYAYSHYTGIILVSTAYFAVYCVVKCNKPQIYPKMILPALLSGIMWGVAMLGWFLANEHLSLAVSFPIVTAGPGFVSFAYGMCLYREIKGWRNIGIYFVALAVSIAGLVMVGLSSCSVHC